MFILFLKYYDFNLFFYVALKHCHSLAIQNIWLILILNLIWIQINLHFYLYLYFNSSVILTRKAKFVKS